MTCLWLMFGVLVIHSTALAKKGLNTGSPWVALEGSREYKLQLSY